MGVCLLIPANAIVQLYCVYANERKARQHHLHENHDTESLYSESSETMIQ